jgi:hypothetical protein
MIGKILTGAMALAAVSPAGAQTATPSPGAAPTAVSAPTPTTTQATTPVSAPATAPTPALPGAPRPTKPEGPAEISHNAPVNGVLVLFGNERCPTDKNGNEIVVCERRSASEQFRIPKDLREFKVTPQNESWAVKAQAVSDPTASGGIGSCSTVGPGGSTGCFLQQAQAARRDKQDKKADQQRMEDALP